MPTATRLIKKYPNRRLYDTQTSAYITLVDIKQLVLDNEDFRVVDAKSNQDLTRGILLQIILEEEAGGTPLFSSSMLVQIIRFYGHATQGMMGTYLEKTMQAFVEIQHRMQEQSKTFYDPKGIPNPELWAQFMSVQAPMVQTMMGNYIEQSKNLFVQMQDQMQTQTRSMFQKFPFSGVPGVPGAAGGSPESRPTEGSGGTQGSHEAAEQGAQARTNGRSSGSASSETRRSRGTTNDRTEPAEEADETSAAVESQDASGVSRRRQRK
jgi:polyhydroxyalkanoate synthesis repressor PhaR